MSCNRIISCSILAIALFLGMLGCATANRTVTVLYQPVVHDQRGFGEVYLAGWHQPTGNENILWVIGTAKNRDGNPVADIVSPVAPADVVMNALNQELIAAGYSVLTVPSLPPEVQKGIVVANVDFKVDDTASLVKEDVTTLVKITLELWKNGNQLKKVSYESTASNFAISERYQLLPSILQDALHQAMQRAVPEIVAALQ